MLVVLDGLGERLYVDSLIQLILVRQLDEEVQGALVGTHLRVEAAHLLIHVHTALREGAGDQTRAREARGYRPVWGPPPCSAGRGPLPARNDGAWPAADSVNTPAQQQS